MTNIFTYTKNIAKSVMYSSVDALAESAPTTKEFVSTNREVISSLYSSMRNLRTMRKRATNYVNNSKIYEAADAGIKAVFEDIKTGKFYNKERISKFEDKVASSMLGDGFDFDDNFDDSFNMSSDSSSDDAAVGSLEATVALSSKDNAEAVSSTVARVGSHVASVNRTNTMMLLNEQIKANNIMQKGFSSVFDRIGEVGKINSDIAATQAENSKKFFEVSTTLMQEQTNILKEILAIQKANAPVAPAKNNSSSSAPKFSDIVGYNGEVNLRAYGKNIVNNFKNALPASLNMINSLGGENSNPFLMFAASPLQFIPNYIAKTLIPKVTKKAVEDFDKTLSGTFSGIMATLKKMENNSSFGDDYFKSEIGRYIGRIFGIQTARPENPNPKNYNKGTMPWNGLAQKSITEVIPGYLRRIESILSGESERVYSYSSGKWTTGHALRREKEEMTESAYREAYRDLRNQMTELLRDSAAFSSEQWKNINIQMSNFLKTIVENDYGNPRFKKGDERNYAKYKVSDEETMRLLLAAFNATDRRERAQLARKSFQARDTLANRLNNLFTDNAEMVELFNGSDVDKGYNPSWTSGGKKRTSAPGFVYNSTIDKILDDKGHNVFYYLQHIYDEFVTFRVNGYGGSGGGYERTPRSRQTVTPHVVRASAARDSRYVKIRSRRPVSSDRYRDIDPLMPGISPEQEARDREAQARYEEEERFNRWAREHGRQLFNAYDAESNRAIYSNIKSRGNQWYGDSNYETYKNSRSVQEFLEDSQTFINKNYNSAKAKRRARVDAIDERAFGDVIPDNSRGKKPRLFDRLAAAETVTEKMAIFTNSVDNLLEAPQKFLTNIMLKADQRLYSLVFGDEDTHYVNGKPVNGILGEMVYQIKGTFSKLNDWFDEKVLNPLKNKGIHGPADLAQYIGEIFGVDLKGTKDSIVNWLFKGNGVVKGVGSNLKEAASAFGNFMSGDKNNKKQQVDSATIDPKRANHYKNISNRIKQRQDNINFFNMMKDYADYLGYGPDFENDEAGTLLKIAQGLYGEYTPVNSIKDISPEFIQNFIRNSKDSRIKGKSNLSSIKNSVTGREYREIMENIISQYNSTKNNELDKNRKELMAVAAAVPGLDLDSDILKALASGSMTRAMVDSKLRFYRNHSDYAANYNHINPEANKYSDPSRKSFIRDKNNRLSVLRDLNSITGKYRSVDSIASTVEQLLAENPDALAEDLRNKIIDKLDNVYASDAESITDNFDINKIIADSDNGEAIIDKEQLNKLLARINVAVNNFNGGNSNNLKASLISKIQELTDNKSIYNAQEASRLGLKIKFGKNGVIKSIDNTPEEIIKILADERSAISSLATGTRYVTKTGLTTIHEGEMVIPSELNPLNPNRGKVSKSTEIANENRVKNKFLSALSRKIGSRASGDKGNSKAVDSKTAKIIEDASASMQTIDDDSYIKFIDGNNIVYRIKEGTDDRGREIWRQTVVSRAEANTNGLPFDASTKEIPPLTVGKVTKLSRRSSGEFMKIASPETIGKKLSKHFRTAAINADIEKEYDKAIDSVKKYGTAGAAGGILGGGIGLGLSALMGMPGGPIVGAAVGAIGNIARKSKTVNEVLFGKIIGTDEEGNEEREGGIIDSDIQKAVKKYVPSMAKFGLGGAAVGLLTPLGPVGGAIVGSALGFMKKSDDFAGFLFGDEGLFSLEDKKKFQKALPNIGVGAAAGALTGLLGGPFGLVGGALVGSAGGFLSTTDKFKELVLGKEYDTGKKDEDGNPIMARHGGLLGAIRKITLDPVKNGVTYLKNTMVDFVQKDIMKPLKDGVKPITNMIKNMFESIGKGVTGSINHFFEAKLGVPIQEFVTDKFLKPIGKAAKTVVSLPFKFMGSIVSAPFKMLGFVGNNIRANQIKSGKDFGSTAEERLAWRDQHKIRSKKIFGSSIFRRFDGTLFNSDGYRTLDENLAAEDDNGIEQLIQGLTQITALRGNRSQALTDTSKTIRDLITSQFDDTGAPGMGASGRILAALRRGQTDKAFKLISTLKSRDGKSLSTEAANSLITSLKDPLQEYSYLTGARKITDTEIDEVNKKLNEFGVRKSRSGKYDYDNILKLLKSERSGRQKTGEWSIEDSINKQIDAASDNTQSIVKSIDGVVSTLQNILYYTSNGQAGNIVTDNIHIKHDENGKKITRRVKDSQGNYIKDDFGNFVEEDIRTDGELSDKTKAKVNKAQQKAYNRATKVQKASRQRIDINTTKYRKLVDSLSEFGYDARSINNFTQNEAVNVADKTSLAIVKKLGELKKSGCTITDDVVIALSNSENVKLSRRGAFGRKQSLFDDICDYISAVRKLTDPERAKKLANMYSENWSNLNLVINTIDKNKGKLHDVLIKDVLDDKTFKLILAADYGSLNTIIEYMTSHPEYIVRYSLKDALSKNGVHIYAEERANAKMYREEEAQKAKAEENDEEYTPDDSVDPSVAYDVKNDIKYKSLNKKKHKNKKKRKVKNRAFGRGIGGSETAVVSKDELIVNPYDIKSYARGKYIQDTDSLYEELGYTEDQSSERELAAKFDNLIMQGRDVNGKKIKKRKDFAFLMRHYLDQNSIINDKKSSKDDKDAALTEQKDLLKDIKTYLSYNTTDDGDVVKKLIDKRGQVYVNKHDPVNKKGLKEGEVNNKNNAFLEKISNAMGKVNYVLTEKPINKEGDTIAGVTGKILGKVGKILLGGTLVGGGIATLLKLLGGENAVGNIKDWVENSAKPAVANAWDNKVKPFFTDTVPGVASNVINGILNFGSGVKDWALQNAGTVGKILGDGVVYAANLGAKVLPTVISTTWNGLESLTGMTTSGNKKSIGERLITNFGRGVLRGSSGSGLRNFAINLPGLGGKIVSGGVNAGTSVSGGLMGGLSHLLRTDTNVYKGLANSDIVENGILRGYENYGTRDAVTVADNILGRYGYGLYDDQYKTILQNVNDSAVETLQKGSLFKPGMTAKEATEEISNNGLRNLSRSQMSSTLYNVYKKSAGTEEADRLLIATIRGTSHSTIEGAIAGWLAKAALALGRLIKKFVGGDASETVVEALSKAGMAKKLLAHVMKLVPDALMRLSTFISTGGLSTVVFTLADFLTPLFDSATAQSVLGISVQPTFLQKLMAAILNCFCGLPIVAKGLIPPEAISWILFDQDIGVLRALDVAGITSARVTSNTIVNEFNRATGANFDVDTYNYVINGNTSAWNATGGAIFNIMGGTDRTTLLKNATITAAQQGVDLDENLVNTWKNASVDDNGNVVFKNTTTNSNGDTVITNDSGHEQVVIKSSTSASGDLGTTNTYLDRITNSIEGLFSYFTGETVDDANTSNYTSTDDTEFIKDIAKSFGYTYEEAAKKLANGEIYGLSGQGSGRYSQKDKNINMRYNKPGDSIYQDINTSGCGPIAATNLINRHIKSGMGFVSPNDAAQYALKHGYKETNGGTLPSYFKDYFSKNDIDSYITSNRSDMRKAIQNGQQVVLMGKDPKYGTGNNPYGPNPHYVVATGMRGSDIIVDNPEEDNEYTSYDAADTIRKSSKAIVTNSKYGMGAGSAADFHKLDQDMSSLDAWNEKKKQNPWLNASVTDDGKGHKTYKYSGYEKPVIVHYSISEPENNINSVSDIPFYSALNSINTKQWSVDDINNYIYKYKLPNAIETMLDGAKSVYTADIASIDSSRFKEYKNIYTDQSTGGDNLFDISNLFTINGDDPASYLESMATNAVKMSVSSTMTDDSNHSYTIESLGKILNKAGTFDIVKNNIINILNNKHSKSDISGIPHNQIYDSQTGKYYYPDELWSSSTLSSITDYFNNEDSRSQLSETFLDMVPKYLAYSSGIKKTAGDSTSILKYSKVENAIQALFEAFAGAARQNLFVKTYEKILQAMKNTGYSALAKLTTEGNFILPQTLGVYDENPYILSSYPTVITDSSSANLIYSDLIDYVKSNSKDGWYDQLIKTISSIPDIYNVPYEIAKYNERFLGNILGLDKYYSETNPAGNVNVDSDKQNNEDTRKSLSYRTVLQALGLWSGDQSNGTGGNYSNSDFDKGKANIGTYSPNEQTGQLLYDALRVTYPESNGAPRYLTPDFLVNLYKKLVEYNFKHNPYVYKPNANSDNPFKAILKQYKLQYNPDTIDDIPTVYDYDDESKYNLVRALAKIMKGIKPNVGFKTVTEYYKSIADDTNINSNIPSLVAAFDVWERDKGNFEDYLKDYAYGYLQSGGLGHSRYEGINDLQNNILNPILKKYFIDGDKSASLIDKLGSLAWGGTYDLISDNISTKTHKFTNEDLSYLKSFYENELLPLKIHGSKYLGANNQPKTIKALLAENPKDSVLFNINAFKTFIDALDKSVNQGFTTSGYLAGQAGGSVISRGNYLNNNVTIGLNQYGNPGNTQNQTPETIIKNLIATIDNVDDAMATVQFGDLAQRKNNQTNNNISAISSKLEALDDLSKKQLILQALTLSDDGMPASAGKDKDTFDYVRYAFAGNGPMPLEMFENLYLYGAASDTDDVNSRINRYFTDEYLKIARDNFSANAMEIFNNLGGFHKDYFTGSVPEANQLAYAKHMIENHPEEIFNYLPTHAGLLADLENMNNILNNPSVNDTYETAFKPLTKYLIPQYTKRNSALNALLGLGNLGAGTTGEADESGNLIQASNLTEMSFDNMAFEDLGVFSNISSAEANGFIKKKYDANGAKNTTWERPLLNTGSTFVSMANKYKVNPRFVLAVMWQEFNLGSRHSSSAHLDKFNFISIMNRNGQGAGGMWDFSKGSMVCNGVTLNQCQDYKGAIENAFKFFSKVSFEKRNQRTLFSLNYKDGYSFAGGTADWINRMITYMNEFTPNSKATYITPTDGELRYFKGIEGDTYLTDTLPEQKSTDEPDNILQAVWNIVKGIFGLDAVNLFNNGVSEVTSADNELVSKYFNTSKFNSAQNFFKEAFEDSEGNPVYNGVSSGFGPRNLAVNGYDLGQHYGMDLTSTAGDNTIIRTPVSGIVLDSGYRNDGYGNRVLLLDDNSADPHVHLFGHLSSVASSLPKVNGTVSRGDILGKMGTTGLSTGNHLHYGVQVPSANNTKLISNKYFGSKSGYSGVANDGLTWENNTSASDFNSEYGWVNPDQYIEEYDQKMIPDTTTDTSNIPVPVDISTISDEDKAKFASIIPPAILNGSTESATKTDVSSTGMGSGKSSLSDQLIKDGLTKAYRKDAGVGGSPNDIKLSSAASAIIGDATKNARKKQSNTYLSGKGGSLNTVPGPGEELEVLKQISATLIAIDKKTAANNEFLVAFLKAVQSGEISAKSPTFNNIMNALSGAGGGSSSSTIDSSTNTLINTMTNIVRQ